MDDEVELLPTPARAIAEPSTSRARFNLLTVFLLVGVTASCVAYWKTSREYHQAQMQYEHLQSLARELVIEDDSLITAVRTNYSNMGNNAWEVFIPAGPKRKLYYLTRDSQLNGSDTSPAAFIELPPGKHLIEHRAGGKILGGSSTAPNQLLIDEQLVSTELPFGYLGIPGAEDASVQNLKTGKPGEPFILVAKRATTVQPQPLIWIE